MTTVQTAIPCPICQESLDDPFASCPSCQTKNDWINVFFAFNFIEEQMARWQERGLLSSETRSQITEYYENRKQVLTETAKSGQELPEHYQILNAGQCWSCEHYFLDKETTCPSCGVPMESAEARRIYYWLFLISDIEKLQKQKILSLSQAHQLQQEARERASALRKRLFDKSIPMVLPVAKKAPPPKKPIEVSTEKAPPANSRSFLELILDPQSIHWLLGIGAGLLVLGLVIWLATLGVFNNPVVIAAILGGCNLALLGTGWLIIKKTKFQTAGRALTFLACLVMPLNLWFYHANGLITLDGQLWMPALVCSVFYFISAWLLRDSLFVYVLMAGVTLTGLLILADIHGTLFLEVAPYCVLLVGLGVAGIALHRAFADGTGPFTKSEFGMAFFWSGQALLAVGLLILVAAQILGYIMVNMENLDPMFAQYIPTLVTDANTKLLALVLVIVGMVTYLYSDIAVRQVGVYIYIGVFCLLWAEILVIDLIPGLDATIELIIVSLAVTALIANLSQSTFSAKFPKVQRLLSPIGLFLASIPVVLGVVLHFRATHDQLILFSYYNLTWTYVAAMAITAVSCRVGAYVYRESMPTIATIYLFGTGAVTLVGAAGLLTVLEIRDWNIQAMIVMLIPILYLVAAKIYEDKGLKQALILVAQTASIAIMLLVITSTLEITPRTFDIVAGSERNLWVSVFFLEVTVFFVLATSLHRLAGNVYLATFTGCLAIWQGLLYLNTPAELYTLVFAIAGVALLVVYRLGVMEKANQFALAHPAFQCGNALLTLALVAGAFIALFKLGNPVSRENIQLSVILLLAGLAFCSFVSAWLVHHQDWRRWYFVMTVIEIALAIITLQILVDLPFWQKVELASVVLGSIVLCLGHVGWFQEKDRRSDLVSLSLVLGSMAVSIPLMIALLGHRWAMHFSTIDELAVLILGIVLLSSGMLFRILSTTLAGAAMVIVYVLTLVFFIRMPEFLQSAAVWMVIGGASIFGMGLLLSIYRDRLLSLPERMKRKEGVFRMLTWR